MLLLAVSGCAFAASSTPSPAASAATVVSMVVPSATNIATTGCSPGQTGRTEFGTVLPGTSAVTSLPCTIQFGSSNDTARLLMRQTDERGVGMFLATRGSLDAGFGAAGKVTSAISAGAGADTSYGAAVQVDGKLVVGGECDSGGASLRDFCLSRYNVNGSVDATFGGGHVMTAIGPGGATDNVQAVAIQPDGKVVATGYCSMGATGNDACIVRYSSNGTLDASFDGDGRLTAALAPGAGGDLMGAIVVQPDGRIAVAGHCDMGVGTGWDLCIARFESDGTPDTSFNGNGRVYTSIAPGAGGDFIGSLEIQADGKLVMSGNCDMGGLTGVDACLMRYNTNGSLDTSFDGDGIVTTAIAPGTGNDQARTHVILADGRITTAGQCDMGGATTGLDACLARYNPNGSLDTTFNGTGKVVTATGQTNGADGARDIVARADGQVTTVGECFMTGTGTDYCLARYNVDGSLDSTFGVGGRVTTAIGAGSNGDVARSLQEQTDGRLVASGFCNMGATGNDRCAVQYGNVGTISQYVDPTNDWDTPGTSHFAACLTAVTNGSASVPTSATCPMIDGTYWRAISTSATQIATATANSTIATAQLQFGMRTASNQPPGSYAAPITFDVVAP